jgi:thioredoxin 1
MEGPSVTVPDPGGNHDTGPEHAVPVTSATVDSLLAGDAAIAIVEFYSPLCGACASLAWVIDSLAVTFGDSVMVGASDITTDTLYRQYAVKTVPTYLLFKAGEEQARCSFGSSEPQVYDSLTTLIDELIAGTLVSDTTDTTDTVDTVPENYLQLDESSFDTTVLRTGVTALVFFQAPAGVPCIAMDSVMRQIAPRFKDRAVIATVYAWENPALCERYGIEFVPQFFFFKDSIEREEHHLTHTLPADTLIAHLEALLNGSPVATPVQLDSTTFYDSVTTNSRIALVEFFSPTCSYCVLMEPIVAELVDSLGNRALIAKVNAPENRTLGSALGVTGWPAFIFFDNGTEYDRIVGLADFAELAEKLRYALDKPADLPAPAFSSEHSGF